ncbi:MULTISPECIES: ankyrin repeat domain-containing protein [unclassified Cupriavidus]|uniref:ankyrin repeat domain-containing protein n=1 Tax=unclassified Cupriavidus TaxID=2640874 RepID=UPI00040D6B74|nr:MULTISPECIES: ankyrin repeat domain-containing protein [unclassified Cupriavidus]MBP0630020.1 ankyrin repeat domain-containing protein [Cupriavidus sp. AcVe19-1a]MBP0634728.1 ankyrin repeat domain-containing protein [Cupriavidus sp. AcVe19-6a]
MTRPATRSRRQALNEMLGLMGLLVGGSLLAAQGGQTLAARPGAGAASQPGAARPRGTARAPVRSEGLSALDRNLITAAGIGDQDMVARLLAAGATARAADERGRSALLAAVQSRHVEVARMLMLAGADVNHKDADANSPFLLAAASGQAEIVRLALAHGADLASTDRYDGTALIGASQQGHVEVVKLLLKAGIAVDHVNNLGWTALLEAVVLGDGSTRYEETVQLLLDAGADANLADREGVTPTRHARERGYKTMVKMLMRVRGH